MIPVHGSIHCWNCSGVMSSMIRSSHAKAISLVSLLLAQISSLPSQLLFYWRSTMKMQSDCVIGLTGRESCGPHRDSRVLISSRC